MNIYESQCFKFKVFLQNVQCMIKMGRTQKPFCKNKTATIVLNKQIIFNKNIKRSNYLIMVIYTLNNFAIFNFLSL